MSEDIKKILREKDKIYDRLLSLLEKQAVSKQMDGGNIEPTNNSRLIFPSVNINNSKITLTQAMNNSFSRIMKYSKRNI